MQKYKKICLMKVFLLFLQSKIFDSRQAIDKELLEEQTLAVET